MIERMVLKSVQCGNNTDGRADPRARDLIEYLSDFFKGDVLNLPPAPHLKYRSREGAGR